ncbi:gamma-glutamylcyclotransferase [Micromonospora sp. S4605]|uniref:gamma-glutamylcyclotransferase n=1 Tax=Micromonospora sp. S4605 TaxID=1420897 RepID=UPI0013053F69|nr:gamma-glutamylcyclotransferase [Micromonospora sp. S4605]
MPSLGSPQGRFLPLFVYGSLKPGELAFGLLEPLVSRHVEATVAGVIRLRDGLPLFDSSTSGRVRGSLLSFPADGAEEAWQIVAEFEPAAQYRWKTTEAMTADGQSITANVLAGVKLQHGISGDPVPEWSASQDPVLGEGLAEVRRLVLEAAPQGVQAQPDGPDFWHQFFRLQASYLLLWSVVERYTALRYGPAQAPMARVRRLDGDPTFQAALRTVGAETDSVVDSRDPTVKITLRPDGTGGARYYYGVRSNLSHRGKGAFRDARLVLKAVVELHDAMLVLLAPHVLISVDPGLDEVRLRHLVAPV